MKVLLLSDTNSEHTEKWALGLAGKGIEIGLFSFNKASYAWYNQPNVTVFFEPDAHIDADKTFTKLSYLKYVRELRRIIKLFSPDILHAHYASSYGLIGALSGFHPFVLSVWGSDVYNFPNRSKLHKKLLQYNIRKADVLMSTSWVMKSEIKKYTSKKILVTPFGVNVENFSPRSAANRTDHIKIGTIKPIEEKYGIGTIIEAAEILAKEKKADSFRFFLIGAGNLEYYRNMIQEKGLTDYFQVTGRIPFAKISEYHNMLDIFLNVSIEDSESFGVATVEAMACEKPVIVTDVGGLMEVVNNGEFGIVIEKFNARQLASAISKLASDPAEARRLGTSARRHVLEKYDWTKNLDLIVGSYNNLLQKV